MSAIDSTLPAPPSGSASPGVRKSAGADSPPTTVNNPDLSAQAHWKPRVNPWLIAMTVALAAFMEVLDTSIANVALPHIGGSLGASTDEATWVLTSYLVSNAIVLPLGGWASSLMGRRNFFVLCISGFTVASFLVRRGAVAAHPASLPRAARHVRRRHAAHGPGHHGRFLRAPQARSGLRALRPCRRARSLRRSHRRRLDHRQLLLALDLLHQYSRRHPGLHSRHAPRRRSSVDQGRSLAPAQHGLHGPGLPHPRHGRPADHARQGRRKRLVLLAVHLHLRCPVHRRHHRSLRHGSGVRKIPSSTCASSASATSPSAASS